MILVQPKHARLLKFCAKGQRLWAIQHGLDWSEYCKNGLPIEQFRALDDEMAQAVADVAEKEVAGG